MEPAIRQELWERYGPSLPSDANLHWELTRDRGFTETGATEFIKEYKSTVAFAQLDQRAEQPAQEATTPVATGDTPALAAASVRPGSPVDTPLTAFERRRSFRIPLISGGTVIVEDDFPLTEQDWAQFMAVLTAMKPALVVGGGVYNSRAQDELELRS